MSISQHRNDYTKHELDERTIAADPFAQFKQWFDETLEAKIPDANAMTLATATPTGRVSARTVLLKDFDERGFCFFTHYHSAKGKQLAKNPCVALVFFWQQLERQVRIEGTVKKMTRAEADEYFQTRPHGSKIGAWASSQSEVIPDRAFLDSRAKEFEKKFGEHVPRPPRWGGYRVVPHTIEFWQGRSNRLHDRLVYRKNRNGKWKIARLAP